MLSLLSSPTPKPDYRPDIDGLRAISIIAIVLFHLDVSFTPGGFVGVDIFFVISGYLITRLLVHEYQSGEFSYLNFLERRLRRIYPALVLLIAVICIVGYLFVTFPLERIQLGHSVMAQAFLSSELFFMTVNSYFDTALEQNLLLHTWTLGVELKFYLLFPLLWLTYRLQKRWQIIAIIAATTIVSFGVNAYLTNLAPSASTLSFNSPWLSAELLNLTAAYFFIASRFWEFLVGALVFLCSIKITSGVVRESLSLFGLVLIFYAIVAFDSTTAFPGWWALVPVVGTACLIYANALTPTRVGSFLSLPPLVALGLISYGVYLWHWPLIVLGRLLMSEITPAVSIMILVLTVILATASYHLVETPIRTRRVLSSSLTFWIFVLATLAATFLAGNIIKNSSVADGRLWDRPEKEVIAEYRCGGTVCYFGSQSAAERTVLLWGDSQAMGIAPLIDALTKESNTRVIAMIHASCPPLYTFGETIFMEPRREGCEQATEAVRNILATEPIDVAIIAARWSAYDVWDDGVDKHVYMKSSTDPEGGPETSATVFNQGTKETIEVLLAHGIEVYALGNIPEGTEFNIREEFYDHLYERSLPNKILTDRAAHEAQAAKSPPALTDNYQIGTYKYLPVEDIFCDKEHCYSSKDGTLLYRDAAHLNHWGVFDLRPLFEPIIK